MKNESENPNIIQRRFIVSKRAAKHPAVDDSKRDGVVFQLALIAVMTVMTICALLFRSREYQNYVYIPPDLVLNIENIPETTASRKVPPPPKMPAVPVESEMEDVLEEIEFEIETLDYIDMPNAPEFTGVMGGVGRSPRPLYDRFPEYLESERKKGHEGTIDVNIYIDKSGLVTKVEVIKNTTKSDLLEKSAIEAAYQTRYQPALDKKRRPISSITTRTYTFGIKK